MKFQIGDTIYWDSDMIVDDTKTAVITDIKNGQYFYTFKNGLDFSYSVLGLDKSGIVRKLTKLEKALK